MQMHWICTNVFVIHYSLNNTLQLLKESLCCVGYYKKFHNYLTYTGGGVWMPWKCWVILHEEFVLLKISVSPEVLQTNPREYQRDDYKYFLVLIGNFFLIALVTFQKKINLLHVANRRWPTPGGVLTAFDGHSKPLELKSAPSPSQEERPT
jgi:hypothetical protein